VILVDSAVWIDLLRGTDTPVTVRLRRLLLDGEAVIAPVILQEVLQGATSPPHLVRLRKHFAALPMLLPRDGATTHAEAGALYARCRWAGLTPRSPHDCLIAQHAIENAVPLLHDDRDFVNIARIEPALRFA
jgi:predicted nucleic acid-binding protein